MINTMRNSESRCGNKYRPPTQCPVGNNLSIVDFDLHKTDDDFVIWESGDCSKYSWIDLALVSENTKQNVKEFRILDEIISTSDHWPISLEPCGMKRTLQESKPSKMPVGVDWLRSTEDQVLTYQRVVDECLSGVTVPLEAICCDQPEGCDHSSYLELYCKSIVDILKRAAHRSIPRKKGKPVQRPGWDKDIQQRQKEASKIYWRWRQGGKPRNGPLFNEMKQSRQAFRRELKRIKHAGQRQLGEVLLKKLKSSNTEAFWKSIKNQRRAATSYSGVQLVLAKDDDEICEYWKDHFHRLGNLHDQNESAALNLLVDQKLDEIGTSVSQSWWKFIITAEDCRSAASRLKSGKAADSDGIQAEHLKNGSYHLYCHIAGLCVGILKHGYLPSALRRTTIIPIIKDNAGSRNDPENYRGIAISSVLGKLIENIILAKYHKIWTSENQQFGFKSGHGCDMAGFVVKEAVSHYLENGNDVLFGCFLDLSKAYDRVSHPILLKKMLERGTPAFIVKFLRNWYDQQVMFVRWNSSTSTAFKVSNGVRQGSVLSPVLFN